MRNHLVRKTSTRRILRRLEMGQANSRQQWLMKLHGLSRMKTTLVS